MGKKKEMVLYYIIMVQNMKEVLKMINMMALGNYFSWMEKILWGNGKKEK